MRGAVLGGNGRAANGFRAIGWKGGGGNTGGGGIGGTLPPWWIRLCGVGPHGRRGSVETLTWCRA